MTTESTIEGRLEAVEEAVKEIRRRHEVPLLDPKWLDHLIGIFEDEPAFDEVVRLGNEYRSADCPAEERGP